MNENQHEKYMQMALSLAKGNLHHKLGGPFGAVIIKNGEVIATGVNRVAEDNDPTAHAEIVAIRSACHSLGTYQLEGCTLYSSCEPCPMCLGAIYWARPERVFYASQREDAEAAGFDDKIIYEEIAVPQNLRKIPMHQILRDEAIHIFEQWKVMIDKPIY